MKTIPKLLLPVCLLALVVSPAAAQTTRTWNGDSAATSNWSDGDNWVGDVAPASGVPFNGTRDPLIFDGSTRLTNIADYPADSAFGTVTFNSTAGAFTINNAVSSRRINVTSWVVENGAGAITINSNLYQRGFGGSFTINGASSQMTLNGVISSFGNFGTLTKAGEGLLILTGSNEHTGATTVQNGTVRVSSIGDFGTTGSLGTGFYNSVEQVIRFGNVGNTGTLEYNGAGESNNCDPPNGYPRHAPCWFRFAPLARIAPRLAIGDRGRSQKRKTNGDHKWETKTLVCSGQRKPRRMSFTLSFFMAVPPLYGQAAPPTLPPCDKPSRRSTRSLSTPPRTGCIG